jgi:transposase
MLLLTEGQASDHRGAALMLLLKLPPPKGSIADRGCDSTRSRAKLTRRGIAACIPSTRLRKHPIPHDTALYRQRHRIETMFARLKDWRRIATRYDRCAHTLLTAITRAAIAIFWLRERVLSLAITMRFTIAGGPDTRSPCKPSASQGTRPRGPR